MPISPKIIKERLRITLGSESQEVVAKKLNVSQGNVSKLVSGSHLPALDTLYSISEIYGVSVDWLLGISEQKKIQGVFNLASYSMALEVITHIVDNGGYIQDGDESSPSTLAINDPLLKALIKKSTALSQMDVELYNEWKKSKLSLFDDKELLWRGTWNSDKVKSLVSDAFSDADWLKVWETAKKEAADLEELLLDMFGPRER